MIHLRLANGTPPPPPPPRGTMTGPNEGGDVKGRLMFQREISRVIYKELIAFCHVKARLRGGRSISGGESACLGIKSCLHY